ncbi:MAG: hypothetical protein J5725_00575 [Bacteroidales bacterium]|nr:hypothetical protein [Bacteroidales bacterium]
MTKEKAVELGITFDTETPTQEEIDEKVARRLTELTGENSKNKDIISKRNSEIAEYKRKEQEKLTADEKRALHEKELEEKLAGYEKQFAKTSKVNDYLSVGYDKELAEEIAEAELSGKSTAELHKKHILAREEAIRKELMEKNPKPKQNDPNLKKDLTTDDFKKMGYTEKLKLKEENPALYEQLSKK